MFFNIEINILD